MTLRSPARTTATVDLPSPNASASCAGRRLAGSLIVGAALAVGIALIVLALAGFGTSSATASTTTEVGALVAGGV